MTGDNGKTNHFSIVEDTIIESVTEVITDSYEQRKARRLATNNDVEKDEETAQENEMLCGDYQIDIKGTMKESSKETAEIFSQNNSDSDDTSVPLKVKVFEFFDRFHVPVYDLVNKYEMRKSNKLEKESEQEKYALQKTTSKLEKQISDLESRRGEQCTIKTKRANMIKDLKGEILEYKKDIGGLIAEEINKSEINNRPKIAWIENEISNIEYDIDTSTKKKKEAVRKYIDIKKKLTKKQARFTTDKRDYLNVEEGEFVLAVENAETEGLLDRQRDGKTIEKRYTLLDKVYNQIEKLRNVQNVAGPKEVELQKIIRMKQKTYSVEAHNKPWKNALQTMDNEREMDSKLSLEEEMNTYSMIKPN